MLQKMVEKVRKNQQQKKQSGRIFHMDDMFDTDSFILDNKSNEDIVVIEHERDVPIKGPQSDSTTLPSNHVDSTAKSTGQPLVIEHDPKETSTKTSSLNDAGTLKSKIFDMSDRFDTDSFIPKDDLANRSSDSIEIIHDHMSNADKQFIIDQVHALLAKYHDNTERLVVELKTKMEKTIGCVWHVLLTDESVWLAIAHIEDYSLHFRMGQRSYLLWMTPA